MAHVAPSFVGIILFFFTLGFGLRTGRIRAEMRPVALAIPGILITIIDRSLKNDVRSLSQYYTYNTITHCELNKLLSDFVTLILHGDVATRV